MGLGTKVISIENNKNCKKVKLGIIALHPIQYQDMLWEKLYIKAQSEGINVKVIFLDKIGLEPVKSNDFNEEIDFKDVIKLEYPHKFIFNLSPLKFSMFIGRVNPSIVWEVLRHDIILIHGVDFLTMQLALIVSKLFGKKVMVRGEGTPKKGNSLIKLIKKKYYKYIDLVFYSCSGNKEYFESYGVPDGKMFLMPCAVDNEFFRNEYNKYSPQRDAIRKEFDIGKSKVVVLFIGRFVNIKRPLDLIKALNLLKKKGKVFTKLIFVFIGGGPLCPEMIQFAKENDIDDNIVIEGFKKQSEISKYYTIADIFVLPSSYDPSPKSLNEAMNFELPVVTTKALGTAPDLVRHGYNGFQFNVNDIEALAKYIWELASNDDQRKLFGKRSWKIVQKWNFNRDVEAIIKSIRWIERNEPVI